MAWEDKENPEIVDIRVQSKGLLTHSLIPNSFIHAISSAHDIK
jgi:hypothetical protein